MRSASKKTMLMTGATSGIGLAAATVFLKQGHKLLLTSRTRTKGVRIKQQLIAQCPHAQIDVIDCDLASLQSTHAAAQYILKYYSVLDVLVNNAGVAEMRHSLTPDGVERTFASNHLGHFLLTYHVLKLLKNSSAARIVNTSSVIHYRANEHFLNDVNFNRRHYFVLRAYADSKLANVLFSNKLARELSSHCVNVNSFHPGHVATAIWPESNPALATLFKLAKKFLYISAEEGAKPLIYLATHPDAQVLNGEFYFKMKPRQPNPLALNQTLQDDLWHYSYDLCKNYI